MSNTLAIAAATSTLRNLLVTEIPKLDGDLADLEVTTQPPDLARKGVTKAQLNLFLYQTVVNAAWRNQDLPHAARPGERGMPPLPLNLLYLVTAYGRAETDNDAVSHRVLGGAMSVLHDHAVLGRAEIRTALPNNDLADQFENLKIVPVTMSLEEMSKLWTTFQTQYRISAAYELSVVLIDSRVAVKAALPVLRQGESDRGPSAQAGQAPSLTEIRPPRAQAAVRLGEDLALAGRQLSIADTTIRFISPRVANPIVLPVTPGLLPGELAAHVPDAPEDPDAHARWAPGMYTAGLLVKRTGTPVIASNELAVAVAPRITVTPANAAAGTVSVTVTCTPRLVPHQRVLLLFGDRQASPITVTTPGDPAQPTTMTFDVEDVLAGAYVVRLRVDGVDSIPAIASGTPLLLEFDPAQRVTVT
jgi:hypothetical protein